MSRKKERKLIVAGMLVSVQTLRGDLTRYHAALSQLAHHAGEVERGNILRFLEDIRCYLVSTDTFVGDVSDFASSRRAQ